MKSFYTEQGVLWDMWKWRMNIFEKKFVKSQNGKHLWREGNCQFTHNKYPENIWKKTWPEQDIKQLLCGWLVTITVEPRLTATSVIRSPLYYGHFFWPHGKIAIHFLVKKKPSLIRSPVTMAKFFFWPISFLVSFKDCFVSIFFHSTIQWAKIFNF